MLYYPFGDPLAAAIPDFIEAIHEQFATAPILVAELWEALRTVAETWRHARDTRERPPEQMFQEVLEALHEGRQ
jgi:hypothetical protein